MAAPSFQKTLEGVSRKTGHDVGRVFRTFALLAACSLSVGAREEAYLLEAKHWEASDLNAFSKALGQLVIEMEEQPYTDLLGPIYQEWGSKGGRDMRGEFYTPQALSKMMAQMVFDPSAFHAGGPVTLLEPACGSGAMVLGFVSAMKDHGISPLRVRATCIDVSPTACDMCFINLTMWGIPAEVIHGNALSLEIFGAWRNHFWYMARSAEASQPAPTAPMQETVPMAVAHVHQQTKSGQILMDFDEAAI